MKIYSTYRENKKRVCCNCRHNIRKDFKCHCDIDGHYIGYLECFECWCRHWSKGENMEIKLSYGAMSESLEKQLNEYGYTLGEYAETVDRLKYSMNMLYLHSMITNTQANAIIKKIAKMVGDKATEIGDVKNEN